MSKIEWTDITWNPITGCTKISAGCKHCYAERMAKRLAGRFGYPADEPFKVTLHPDRLDEPSRWRKPRKVFVCSMGDLFHDDVPYHFTAAIWRTMALSPQHTFQVLTKRPETALDFLIRAPASISWTVWKLIRDRWPLPNVWIGVSAENQEQADKRIPILLQMPAAVRSVSFEPLLGPIKLKSSWLFYNCSTPGANNWDGLDWAIIGGETGPSARPMYTEWAQSIVDQCQAADVPVFVKQLGTRAARFSKLKSHKGADMSEWPEKLRTREFPNIRGE